MISIIDVTCKVKCVLFDFTEKLGWGHDCVTHFKPKHTYNKNPLKPLPLISLAPVSVVDDGKQASKCILKYCILKIART